MAQTFAVPGKQACARSTRAEGALPIRSSLPGPLRSLGAPPAVEYSSARGRPMGGKRPSGTVTFLFTEIEDSTRRSEDAATDMAAALLSSPTA